jgi:hypothetical protein
MIRVTVCWSPDAEGELASVWMSDRHPSAIERSANEIDALLRVDPSTKGLPTDLLDLPADMAETLLARLPNWSVDLRCVRCGPLEVFFTVSEEDRQANVWCVRRR